MRSAIGRAASLMWPRTLFARLGLILFGGLAAAHVLSFAVIMFERVQASSAMMLAYVAKDVATAVAVLERIPPGERSAWLPRLARNNYRYVLNAPPSEAPAKARLAKALAPLVGAELGPAYDVRALEQAQMSDGEQIVLDLRLTDGTPLTIHLVPPGMSVSVWLPAALLLQLALLGLVTWFVVSIASRPLQRLAGAADALGPDFSGPSLLESGPREVARAAVAFNAMQRRIREHVAEQLQMIAAISHDLQTPITRMRLRADLLEDGVSREKLHADLNAMQALVEDGIAYARSVQEPRETPCAVDLHALLDSLVCDYADAGRHVALSTKVDCRIVTRPQTLRRIVTNLVDNALKFGTGPEIVAEGDAGRGVTIAVLDRGPGIPAPELDAVLRPFHRIEGSRNRETGGSGLGLAIAQRLTSALGGRLTLANRRQGGLEARLSFGSALGRTD
jgi:signal transduction histidine kinase